MQTGVQSRSKGVITLRKMVFALVTTLSLALLGGCSGEQQVADTEGQTSGRMRAGNSDAPRDRVAARAGKAEARAASEDEPAVARAGRAVARAGKGSEREKGKANRERARDTGMSRTVLEIKGKPGTSFSGTCSVGGTEREIDGRVPQRLVFPAEEGKVECEIEQDGPGKIKMRAFSSGKGREKAKTSSKVDIDVKQLSRGSSASSVHIFSSQSNASGAANP